MRELDLLLERFVDQGLASLDARQTESFERLLEESADQDLLAWLTGSETPDEPELSGLVEVVRAHLTGVHPSDPG